jgi:hypothetical protein
VSSSSLGTLRISAAKLASKVAQYMFLDLFHKCLEITCPTCTYAHLSDEYTFRSQ